MLKKLEKLLIKNKIKKSPFLKNFFHWLETIDYLGYFDPSPHRQQVGSATLPKSGRVITPKALRVILLNLGV